MNFPTVPPFSPSICSSQPKPPALRALVQLHADRHRFSAASRLSAVMVRLCTSCHEQSASVRRPKTGLAVCKACFFREFESEIHDTIVNHRLFKRGDKVAIGASGGKDSTVLAYILSLLNRQHDYGLDLFLLSIDEGISGYRDDSLSTVHRNKVQYNLPLLVISYQQLYGWTMDEIVKTIGTKSNCTYCGVLRRQALDRGACLLNANCIATGHNADDIAETILLNLLRGDYPRLQRCTNISIGSELVKVKPFKYVYEKEIVMYAYFKKLDYFATECIYSPNAYRGFARQFIKDLEIKRSTCIIDIIRSAEMFEFPTSTSAAAAAKLPVQRQCERCAYISSQRLCKACVLLDNLKSKKTDMCESNTDENAHSISNHAPLERKVAVVRGAGAAEDDDDDNGSADSPQSILNSTSQCGG